MSGANPTITGNVITHNMHHAVEVEAAATGQLAGNTIVGDGNDGIFVNAGIIGLNSTWGTDAPYVLNGGHVTLPAGVTLTVAPGAVVKGGYQNGQLIVQGNAGGARDGRRPYCVHIVQR